MPLMNSRFGSSCSKDRRLVSVRLLEALASAFVNTFGITQPTDDMRRRAAWFILGLLILMIVAVFTIGYAYYAMMPSLIGGHRK